MKNPLIDVPLNTKKVYVMATADTGCKVYMPVNSFDDKQQIEKRDELQAYLDTKNPLPPLMVA